MNPAKPILQESNYIKKENKIFIIISNNIQYTAVIKKIIDKIYINISFQSDSNKKEYESYFSLESIYSLNNEFLKYRSKNSMLILLNL